jgi:hypothetical protein
MESSGSQEFPHKIRFSKNLEVKIREIKELRPEFFFSVPALCGLAVLPVLGQS